MVVLDPACKAIDWQGGTVLFYFFFDRLPPICQQTENGLLVSNNSFSVRFAHTLLVASNRGPNSC